MNYTEAINLAKAGDERGYNFLYAETFKSKYYLALQYMKNEDAAQDVLQDAYMKAFANLNMLTNPEAFSGWLGRIVANTAKNELVKKNPALFTDVAVDDKDGFEFQIEDDNQSYQPESAYTKQETQELVHKLIDKLSVEQRMCILMFHIEGESIKEIAATLECSDNTVKSRLKYGRDNLRIEAEKLQKKGYKLYSAAPIPLLLYLLRTDLFNLSQGGGSFAIAGNQVARQVLSSQATSSALTGAGGVTQAGAQVAKTASAQAAKVGLLHTATGKAAIAVLAISLVGSGGAVAYGISEMNINKKSSEIVAVEEGVETPVATPMVEMTPAAALTIAPKMTLVPTEAPGGPTVDEIYAGVRQAVINQEPGYEFSDAGRPIGNDGLPSPTLGYSYFLYDIDGDGIEEMIVGAEYAQIWTVTYDCRVYSCEKTENGYKLKPIAFDGVPQFFCSITGKPGLYNKSISRGLAAMNIYKVTIQEGQLVESSTPEYSFGDEYTNRKEWEDFENMSQVIEWIDIATGTE